MDKEPNLKLVILVMVVLTGAFIAYLLIQEKELPAQLETPAPPAASDEPDAFPVLEPVLPLSEPSVIPFVIQPVVTAPDLLISTVASVPTLAPEGPAHTIIVEDFIFKPQNITVSVGTTVDWMYGTAKYKHKVHISANKEAETPGIQSVVLERTGDSWNYTFTKPGWYEYFDVILPTARGWVTVN